MTIVIVFGNEKGGTGKSTLTFHVAVALAKLGLTVSLIDGDYNQGSLTTYLKNRKRFIETHADAPLVSPELASLSDWQDATDTEIATQIADINTDIVVIDTPGSYSALSKKLHSCADLIVTPLNDSLIDMAVLADVDPESGKVLGPRHYAERIWQARQVRAARDGKTIDWIVLRHRLSALDAHTKRTMSDIIEKLAKRVGFRVGPGFGERVIFKELFLQGLTLSDFEGQNSGFSWTLSHVAARQELRDLIDIIAEYVPAVQMISKVNAE